MATEPDSAFVMNCKPTKLPWLKPSTAQNSSDPDDDMLGIFDNLSEDDNHNDKMFQLFEFSLPPFFNIKYYNFKVENYHETFEGANGARFISNCIGLLHWNQSIYYEYCSYVDTVRDYDDNNDDGFKWESSTEEFIYLVHKLFLGEDNTSPSDADLCQCSADFLLEPCVLVQLPWQPCIFHQWLTAALAEVLLFEKETLEFRHWPMSNDIVPLVTNLLSLVRDLKQRILLGFAILNEQIMLNITKQVRHERKFVENIMDNVILPSLPTLEFLTSERSKCLLQDITYLHRAQDERNSYIHKDCYTLLPSLESFSLEFSYNFHKWLQDEVTDLYNMVPEKIGHIAAQLNEPRPSDVEDDSCCRVKPLSSDEDKLHEYFLSDLFWYPEDCLDITKDVVCEMIVQTNRLKTVSVVDVENKFSEEEALKCDYDVYVDSNDNIYNAVVKQACTYKAVCELLVGVERYESVASQIITLQLEIVKQEQLVRLTQSCALLFNAKLTIPPPYDERVVNDEELMSEIDQVREEIKKQKRKSFWMKFPKYWRQTVNPYEEIVEPNSVDKVIFQMRERIGRLIVNCNKAYLENNNGKIDNYFEEVNILQYLLPCFVYGYARSVSKNNRNSIFFKFIKTLLCKQFEEEFVNFCKIKSKITPYYIDNVNTAPQLVEYGQEIKFMTNSYFVGIKIAIESMAKVHGAPEYFEHMYVSALSVLHYSINTNSSFSKSSFTSLLAGLRIFKSGMQYLFKFLRDVYNKSCRIGFDIPSVDTCTFPRFPLLKDLYFTSMVLYDLSWVIPMGNTEYMTKVEEMFQGNYIEDLQSRVLYAFQCIQDHVLVESSKNVAYNAKKFYFDFKKIRKIMNCMFLFNCTILKFLQDFGLPVKEQDILISKFPHSSQYDSVSNAVHIFLTRRDVEAIAISLPLLVMAGTIFKEEGIKICRSCGKAAGKLKPCKQCVAQKYPEVSYYCGKKCEAKMWKLEHMAEHLEFELDLGEFSSLNVSNESEPTSNNV